ncbi:Hypothetical predicted protein [Mytilus galloprovincialis]|uniref:Ig-like domain-containing protein n=1 Tax=Mytilus galloprovincialis TaxID=29158 RepID=A0A8B6DFN9_MYTGA|nr:Hypothetical predicted protein [Mytilus galloprovincialis]
MVLYLAVSIDHIDLDNYQYFADPPQVTVYYIRKPDYIDFICNATGEPSNYTFLQWVHASEFHKQIRLFNGTGSGRLRVENKNQSGDTGYYICRLSNGIPDIKGKTIQEARIFFISKGPPEFLLDNMQVKYGAIGNLISFWIQIYSNNELLNSTIQRYDGQNNVTSNTEQTKVLGYIKAHGVRVMVLGTKLHFEIHIQNTDDFTNYTILVCNARGCSNMTLELRAANQIKNCASDIPLDVQYDEIGNIEINRDNIQNLRDNVQEPASNIDLSGLEGMVDQLSSFENISSSYSSSDNSVQRLSMMNDDGYENPYQTVDPENIETHPYSIVCSHLYENTIVFPKKILIKHSKERDPWLIIYKQTCRCTQKQL